MEDSRLLSLPRTLNGLYTQNGKGMLSLVPYAPAPSYEVAFHLDSVNTGIFSLHVPKWERVGELWNDPLIMRYYEQNLGERDPFLETRVNWRYPPFHARLYDISFFNPATSAWVKYPQLTLLLKMCLACAKAVYFDVSGIEIEPPEEP